MENTGCEGSDGPNRNGRSRQGCATVRDTVGRARLCGRDLELCTRRDTAGHVGIDAGEGSLVGTRVIDMEDGEAKESGAVYRKIQGQEQRRLRWPELSQRFQVFQRTSERYEGEASNISSEVYSNKYTKYIY